MTSADSAGLHPDVLARGLADAPSAARHLRGGLELLLGPVLLGLAHEALLNAALVLVAAGTLPALRLLFFLLLVMVLALLLRAGRGGARVVGWGGGGRRGFARFAAQGVRKIPGHAVW